MKDQAASLFWTPKRASDQMVAALIWARHCVAPPGPAGIRSTLPTYHPSLEDHLEEGWGLPESADKPDEKRIYLPPSPDQVQRHIAALQWPARYLAAEFPLSARVLAIWLQAQAYNDSFSRLMDRRDLSRAHAYRLRDRGLAAIAMGLAADGVTP